MLLKVALVFILFGEIANVEMSFMRPFIHMVNDFSRKKSTKFNASLFRAGNFVSPRLRYSVSMLAAFNAQVGLQPVFRWQSGNNFAFNYTK